MKKSVLLFVVVASIAVGSFVVPTGGLAYAAPKHSAKSDPTFTVVKIGDDYECIPSASLKDKKKGLADEFKNATKKWQDEKKNDPNAEKPVLKTLSVVKKGFKTQEDAKKFIDDLKDKGSDTGKSDGKSKPVF